MDFQIYEKIFKEKDEIKKYKILKNIAYIKIKEHNDLTQFFPILINNFSETISQHSPQKNRNERFLLLLLFISQSLKENNKLSLHLHDYLGKLKKEEIFK